MRKIGEALDWLSCFALGSLTFFLAGMGDLHWLWTFPGWGVLGVGYVNLRRMWRENRWWSFKQTIDPRTGRPVGDHGTYEDAVTWFLDQGSDIEDIEFLKWWRMGAAHEEWPEFYAWLKEREK